MTLLSPLDINGLQDAIIDIIPNPVFIKNENLEYIFINAAFEELFQVKRKDIIGQLDRDFFKYRQVSQCNGGDLRVLNHGEIDEAYEMIDQPDGEPKEIITRKNRLKNNNGELFLVGIIHDISEISRTNRELEKSQQLLIEKSKELKRMALTDPLTGCSNRRGFTKQANKALKSSKKINCLLVMDIDFFKKVNDTWGHDVGDAVLIHFSELASKHLRVSDKLSRVGGEEFAALLPNIDIDDARSMAERVRHIIETTPLSFNGQNIHITISIGLVEIKDSDGSDLTPALKKADGYLYQAKKEGRNRIVYGN